MNYKNLTDAENAKIQALRNQAAQARIDATKAANAAALLTITKGATMTKQLATMIEELQKQVAISDEKIDTYKNIRNSFKVKSANWHQAQRDIEFHVGQSLAFGLAIEIAQHLAKSEEQN